MPRGHKILAVIDANENGMFTLIIKGDDKPFIISTAYLPEAKEGDIIEISFKIKKDKRKRETSEITGLIKELRNN